MAGLNASVCFFPDGKTNGASTNPVQVPCDPSAANSACCPIGASCVGSGLCYSNHGGIMRGSCTDKTWNAPECSRICKDQTGGMAGNQESYNWLTQCPFSESGDEFTWQCGLTVKCTDKAFPLAIGGIEQYNISGLAADPVLKWNAATPSQSAPVEKSPTSTNLQCAKDANQNSGLASSISPTVVGVAVGVPLAILFLVALGSTFWYRRKWMQSQARGAAVQPTQVEQVSGVSNARVPTWELHQKTLPVQLDAVAPAVYEIGEYRS